MLYLITGNDNKKAREHITAVRTSCGDDVTYRELDGDTFSQDACAEAVASQGLFGQKTVVVLRGVMADKAAEAFVLSSCEDFAQSPAHVIVWEDKLLKKPTTSIQKHTHQSWECSAAPVVAKPAFSVFSLADAVGKRDKKQSWILFQCALASGVSSENIYGTLLWQMKVIALIQQAKTQGTSTTQLGLKPFVVQKASSFSQKYSPQEVKLFLSGLVAAYHKARRGEEEMEIGLERLLLML